MASDAGGHCDEKKVAQCELLVSCAMLSLGWPLLADLDGVRASASTKLAAPWQGTVKVANVHRTRLVVYALQ